jgi:dihydrodipicolinate synthase/N-acetylneuraminate lyase
MKTSAVTTEDLARSVIAVPPLARRNDMSLDPGENRRLVEHLGRGGVSTLLYGGNANLYNVGVSDYGALLDLLEECAPEDAWMIPSIGADFGKALDQAAILRGRAFPTAMVLPLASPLTTPGVAGGLRRLADAYGRPLIVYVKAEGYLTPGEVAALVKDGVACAVKYAIVRKDPKNDAFLAELVQKAGIGRIVSGIGERPAIDHLTVFGLTGFTSGSVCVAPALSSAILAALKSGDIAAASRLRESFLPLEDLRDLHSPIRVLHEAVRLAGVAGTGPLYPFLSNIEDRQVLDSIGAAARELFNKNLAFGERSAAQ